MSFDGHITRYSVMPISPVEENTAWFDAGAVRIGVEYRLLDDAIAAAAQLSAAAGESGGEAVVDDRGVSLHVCGEQDGEWREFLRFDCFAEDPHYHYVGWRDKTNEMLHLDPVADGDPLAWALERIRTRLPQMLTRAGAGDVAARVAQGRVEAVLAKNGKVTLKQGGKVIAEGKTGGSMRRVPLEGLHAGNDGEASVGDYKAPGAFNGTIEKLTLRLGKVR